MDTYIVVCTVQGEPKMCPFESAALALKFVRAQTNEVDCDHMLKVDRHGNVKMFQIGFNKTLRFESTDEVIQ